MGIKERMSGNEAVAYAMKQINPDVMPAFPITPSTELPQFVSSYIAHIIGKRTALVHQPTDIRHMHRNLLCADLLECAFIIRHPVSTMLVRKQEKNIWMIAHLSFLLSG